MIHKVIFCSSFWEDFQEVQYIANNVIGLT